MKYIKILLASVCALLVAIALFDVKLRDAIRYLISFHLVTTLFWIIKYNNRVMAVLKNEIDLNNRETLLSKVRFFVGIWIFMGSLIFMFYGDFGRAKYFIIFALTYIFIEIILDYRKLFSNKSKKVKNVVPEKSLILLSFLFILFSSVSLIFYNFHKNRGMFFEFNNQVFYFPIILITSAIALRLLITIIRKQKD